MNTAIKLIVLFTIVVVATTTFSYVIFNYHFVDHQRYYQVTGKFWKDDSGFSHTNSPGVWDDVDGYWYHLKGHKDVEADSKNQWMAMSVGTYVLVEWQTFERNFR